MKMNLLKLSMLGVAMLSISSNAYDWQVHSTNEWNSAKEVNQNGVKTFKVTGSGAAESEKSYFTTQVPVTADSIYELKVDGTNNLLWRVWPIGGIVIETPFFKSIQYAMLKDYATLQYMTKVPQDFTSSTIDVVIGQESLTGNGSFKNFSWEKLNRLPLSKGTFALNKRTGIVDNVYYANHTYEDATIISPAKHHSFGEKTEMIFENQLPDTNKFTTANYRVNGSNLKMYISNDGKNYYFVGDVNGGVLYTLPTEFLNSNTLNIKLVINDKSKAGSYNFGRLHATVDGKIANLSGESFYIYEKKSANAKFSLDILKFSEKNDCNSFVVTCKAVNNSNKDITFRPVFDVEQKFEKVKNSFTYPTELTLKANSELTFDMDVAIKFSERVDFALKNSNAGSINCKGFVNRANLYNANYGATLAQNNSEVQVWAAPSGVKIAKNRMIPQETATALTLAVAANEAESAQLVINPKENFENVTLEATDLVSVDGLVVAKNALDFLTVDYVLINDPTDDISTIGFWPDPLPLMENVSLVKGINNSFWVTAKVPADTPKGLYKTNIKLLSNGKVIATIPFELEVFGFALPDKVRCIAVSDIMSKYVEQAHNVTTLEDKKAVFEKYLKLFSDYKIAPYNPLVYTPYIVKYDQAEMKNNQLYVPIDFTEYDKERKRIFNEYSFNQYVVQMPAFPNGKDYRSELTKEEAELYAASLRTLNQYIVDNNLQNIAFAYVWDEPHIQYFDAAKKAVKLIKTNAPDIRIFVTPFWPEEHWDEVLDIFCTSTDRYVDWCRERIQKKGKEYWWYLCTGPKTPYAALFIDHPGNVLRNYLWQTYENKVTGTLIWTSTFWCACNQPNYPKRNIYKEPMVINESQGEFGNADGVMIYPPRKVYETTEPVIEGGVPTIRFAMWRDGLEDYEYLMMLQDLYNAKKSNLNPKEQQEIKQLLEVPQEIGKSLYNFSKNPKYIENQRIRIAKAIEFLKNK